MSRSKLYNYNVKDEIKFKTFKINGMEKTVAMCEGVIISRHKSEHSQHGKAFYIVATKVYDCVVIVYEDWIL